LSFEENAMNKVSKWALYSFAAAVLLVVDFAPGTPLALGLLPDALAIVGAPLTPVSAAGVARRTTRRVVVAGSATASSTAAANQQAAASASASAAAASASAAEASAAAAAPAAPAFPVGTTVSALPAGCVSTTIGGASYFDCDGTFFQPAFQSNNLVYVVAQP
jgi:hypothetical protein